MRQLVTAALVACACACSSKGSDDATKADSKSVERDPEPEPPAVESSADSPTPPGGDATGAEAEEPAQALDEPVVLDNGLPAITRGSAIRLRSLQVGSRKVGELEVPKVELADMRLLAALDERLLRHAEFGRCEVTLALRNFVALRCVEVHASAGGKQHDHHIAHFVLGARGEVREVDVWTLFHPGVPESEMIRRLVHDPGAGARRVVATELGIELSYPFDGEDEIDLLLWRTIAPYIRADGPLGPALITEGLPLAPMGTRLPVAPVSPALWANSEAALLRVWADAPPRVRARSRLITSGGHTGFGLVFAPDIVTGEVAELEQEQVERGSGYYTELFPFVVAVRTRAVVQLRDEPGVEPSTGAAVPNQTVLISVDGLVRGHDSTPGTGPWAYVVSSDAAGWVDGAQLEVLGPSYEANTVTPAPIGHEGENG